MITRNGGDAALIRSKEFAENNVRCRDKLHIQIVKFVAIEGKLISALMQYA